VQEIISASQEHVDFTVVQLYNGWFRKRESRRVEHIRILADRADVASPDLVMVLNVQFGKGHGISLVMLIRVNTHEGRGRGEVSSQLISAKLQAP